MIQSKRNAWNVLGKLSSSEMEWLTGLLEVLTAPVKQKAVGNLCINA